MASRYSSIACVCRPSLFSFRACRIRSAGSPCCANELAAKTSAHIVQTIFILRLLRNLNALRTPE